MRSFPTMHIDKYLSNPKDSHFSTSHLPKKISSRPASKAIVMSHFLGQLAQTSHGAYHEIEFYAKPVIVDS